MPNSEFLIYVIPIDRALLVLAEKSVKPTYIYITLETLYVNIISSTLKPASYIDPVRSRLTIVLSP